MNDKIHSVKYNFIMNFILTATQFIFPLITFPYATRILHTQNYGKFSFAASIISYFALIAALGISNYAVREGARIRERKKELESFVGQLFSINILKMLVEFPN